MEHERWWGVGLAVGVLLLFAAVGVYTAVRPDWCMTRPLFWRQGPMERTMQRDHVRVAGVLFSAVSLWMLYQILSWASGS